MIEYILMFDQICTKSISAFSHVQRDLLVRSPKWGGVVLTFTPSLVRTPGTPRSTHHEHLSHLVAGT
jgi:hypothetical protein